MFTKARRAREAGAVMLSKDSDFAELVTRLGAPPQVLWVTCGNTTNRALRDFLTATLPTALLMLGPGRRKPTRPAPPESLRVSGKRGLCSRAVTPAVPRAARLGGPLGRTPRDSSKEAC
ncbi:MAG: hypothetical protein R3E98_15595 [Gemmatimonadota bacterium]